MHIDENKLYHRSIIKSLYSLSEKDIVVSDDFRAKWKFQLWRDMCSEYDAHFLYDYLYSLNIQYNEQFNIFLKNWYDDEMAHYLCMRKINQLVYGYSISHLDHEVKSQQCFFEDIKQFMKNEFEILACIAINEIVSAKGYLGDYALYSALKNPVFINWMKLASKEEANHANNCIKLIEQFHLDKIHFLPEYFQSIVKYEISGKMNYKATFLFDHDKGEYDITEIVFAANSILKHFSLPVLTTTT